MRTRATSGGRTQYPSMHGANGWYGWRDSPWDVGAVDVWYWSQRPEDLPRMTETCHRPTGPAPTRRWGPQAGSSSCADGTRVSGAGAAMGSRSHWQAADGDARDTTPPDRRLADNMLDYNPVAVESLVQLMWGALMPGRNGGLLNARLRYFDPVARRAGVPEDVAALVSELSDTRDDAHAGQPQRDRAPHRDRAGRRVRRAPVGERDPRRQDDPHRPGGVRGTA